MFLFLLPRWLEATSGCSTVSWRLQWFSSDRSRSWEECTSHSLFWPWNTSSHIFAYHRISSHNRITLLPNYTFPGSRSSTTSIRLLWLGPQGPQKRHGRGSFAGRQTSRRVGNCRCKITEGDTLGVRFFTAFCNHWHCTCAMVLSLLCNHWQFRLGFSAMAKQNQNPKNKTQKKQKTKNLKSGFFEQLGSCQSCVFHGLR